MGLNPFTTVFILQITFPITIIASLIIIVIEWIFKSKSNVYLALSIMLMAIIQLLWYLAKT